MAGKKGRSGRKSKSCEEKRLAIIEKAWDIVGELLNNSEADVYYKLQYAIDIVKRTAPQEIKGNQVSVKQIIVVRSEKEYGQIKNSATSSTGSLCIQRASIPGVHSRDRDRKDTLITRKDTSAL